MSTKLTTLDEVITANVTNGLYGYFGTNKGNLYRVLLSSGAVTRIDSVGEAIISLSVNYPSVYFTTNRGSAYVYTIAESYRQVFVSGTSGSPVTDDTPGLNFVEMYFDSGATSGWNGGLYLTYYATGAAGNFTAIEGDVTVSAAVANTTGIESFMAFSAGGKVTGHAAACQATIDYANAALAFSGGAYMAARFNIKGEGSACDPSGAIRISCLELQTQGTFATGKDFELHAAGYAIYFNGFTAAANVTKILSSVRLAELPAGTVGIRVGVGADGEAGTAYYIPLVLATEWN